MIVPVLLGLLVASSVLLSLGGVLFFSLFQSNHRFRIIAESTKDLVCLHDLDGTYTWVSPSSLRVLGHTPQEMVGRSPLEFLHAEDKQGCQDALLAVANLHVEVGNSKQLCRMRHASGRYVWVEVTTESFHPRHILTGRARKGFQIRTVSRDVSSWKQIEDQYEQLIGNLPNISVFLFNRDLSYLVAKGAVADGLRASGDSLPSDMYRLLYKRYKRALQGEPSELDEAFRMRDYHIHFLPVNGKQADGMHDLGMAVFHDVTDERAVFSALKERTADLERSNRDLEQFAHIASHEMKAPLRRISSFAELLVAEYKGVLSDDADTYLEHTIDGVHTLQGVIESLLTYSRVQTDRSRMGCVDMAQVFKDATENLSILIRERGACVTAEDLPHNVLGDAVLLRQLLENLINNGIKFNNTSRNPKVHVTAYRDILDWRISVADNGPGIHDEHGDKVFSMFSRLRPEVEGNGIGLALCKKIVGIHRGSIWYDSLVGRGTVFHVSLPASDVHKGTQISAPAEPRVMVGFPNQL